MIASILITGAFHEDGFADVCDGFGGGWTKQKILEIMKDSRIGVYGVIGLILILGLKFSLLFNMKVQIILIALVVGHSLSRFAAVSIIFTHNYVRENDDSKAKPLGKKITSAQFLVASVFGLIPLLLFENYIFFLILIPVLLTRLYLTSYFKKWIGGYTGDCLGAAQQVTEIITYLSIIIILWKYI
jgi:adenosylcobinamide-GDP ribazoletransferase